VLRAHIAGALGLVAIAAMSVALYAGAGHAPASVGRTQGRIPAAAAVAISRTLGAAEPAYYARRAGSGFELANAAQGFSARLSRAGATVSLPGGTVSLAPPAGPASAPLAQANRVWLGALHEWLANGPAGLEQGFTVTNPAQTTIELGISGSLRPRLEQGAINFDGAGGRPLLRYGDLSVTDAHGRTVPSSLSLSGDRLLIQIDARGATYPLAVDPLLNETAKLTASDGADDDQFGTAVAVSGTTIAVGAPAAVTTGTDATTGAVYVFTEPPGGWSSTDAAPLHEAAKLITSDDGQQVGNAVAIDGSTIVAGARLGDENSNTGTAYVWTEPPGGWSGGATTPQVDTAELTGSGGQSVAISGSTVVVGSGGSTVYVYTEPEGGWGGTIGTPATLTLSSGPGGGLGLGVAISGSTIVAGAPSQTVNTVADEGAAYVFTEPQGGWSGSIHQAAELTSSPSYATAGGSFGSSVGIDGSTIAVGAPLERVEDGDADVFTEPTGGWSGTLAPSATLLASNGADNARLGNENEIAVQGDDVLAGAQGQVVNGHIGAGSMYIFTKPAGGWSGDVTETAGLVATDGAAGDDLGDGVAISGATIVGGAEGAYTSGSGIAGQGQGAAYEFTLPTLTVATGGTGSGTVAGPGIACPGTCSVTDTPGTMVTLTATPATGSTFAGWSGGGCTGTGSCLVTLNVATTVTATFNKKSSPPPPPPPPKAPSCKLTPAGSKASSKGGLKLSVRCTESVSVKVSGKVTATPKRKRGAKKKPKPKTYTFKSVSGSGSTLTLSLKLPGPALTALKHGARESAAFTLTGSNAIGKCKASASIARLKLA
jgi:FG-GAP repeat/Divergent InlB B-repeat domain